MNLMRRAWRAVVNAWPLTWRWNRQVMVVDSTASLEMIRRQYMDGGPSVIRSAQIRQLMEDEVHSHEIRDDEATSEEQWLTAVTALGNCRAGWPADDKSFPSSLSGAFGPGWESVATPVRARSVHWKNDILGLSFETPEGVLRIHMTEWHARWVVAGIARQLGEAITRRRFQSPSSSGSPSDAESRPPGPEKT